MPWDSLTCTSVIHHSEKVKPGLAHGSQEEEEDRCVEQSWGTTVKASAQPGHGQLSLRLGSEPAKISRAAQMTPADPQGGNRKGMLLYPLRCITVVTDDGYRYQYREMERCHNRKLSYVALALGLVCRRTLPVHYGRANPW